jgi:Fe-S-cluster-containing hydrogenase component 2
VTARRCHGCQACVMACALTHAVSAQNDARRVAPDWARLRVAVDSLEARQQVQVCRQCARAACAAACPRGAISYTVDSGVWTIDEALCDGCGDCVPACPFGVMALHPKGREAGRLVAAKCETCAGAPECVASCPSGALTWVVDCVEEAP